MKPRVRSAFLLALASALLTSAYGQAPGVYGQDPVPATEPQIASVRAGGLDFDFPPPGTDLVEAGPDYRVVLEPLAPINNRLIAGFLPPDELKMLTQVHALPPLHHYALVEIPRRAEFANVDPQIFKQIADAMSTQIMGDLTGTLQEQQAEVNRRLKALGSSNTVTLEKPLPLGTLFSKPDECGFGILMPVTTKNGTDKLAVGITVIRVHNRVIFTYFYSPYKDESTVAELKTTNEHWADEILQANQ